MEWGRDGLPVCGNSTTVAVAAAISMPTTRSYEEAAVMSDTSQRDYRQETISSSAGRGQGSYAWTGPPGYRSADVRRRVVGANLGDAVGAARGEPTTPPPGADRSIIRA